MAVRGEVGHEKEATGHHKSRYESFATHTV